MLYRVKDSLEWAEAPEAKEEKMLRTRRFVRRSWKLELPLTNR
jgi:hypothetical protein